MTEKDIISILSEPQSLISNEYYFKFIFKKTEKIICAVFLILSDIRKSGTEHAVIHDLEKEALTTLSFIGETLSFHEGEKQEAARRLVYKLVLLESKLRVLHAVGLLSIAHLNVFVAEIDATMRSARGLREEGTIQKEKISSAGPVPDKVSKVHGSTLGGIRQTTEIGQSRKERISTVLRAQPGASIKDISDTIKDCSEKTIQRELNDMIKDGLVIREGEKRWSRYRLYA